ncbi:MAG: hypothetical protein JXA67_09350 [Micromonosporaceae bacterium]|nr:hypothetical protein [Micromonosporaceae bacterium]
MPVGDENLIDLIRGLASPDAGQRERSAETVSDWITAFSSFEARLLTSILSAVILVEKDRQSRESELHAAFELIDTGFIRAGDIERVQELNHQQLAPSEKEYLDTIAELIRSREL